MIRRVLYVALSIALMASIAGPRTSAAAMTLGEWLYSNTGLSQASGSGSGTAMTSPDYLAGKTKTQMCGVISRFGKPSGNAGTWLVLAYDRVHRLGLAASSTDACNVALFSAPPPPGTIRAADLSTYETARGIRIGSTYGRVLATYGGKPKSGAHFIAGYTAPVPGERSYDGKRFVKLSEDVFVKVDQGRVSSIAVMIDLGDLT